MRRFQSARSGAVSLALFAMAAAAPMALARDEITRSFPFNPGETLRLRSDRGHIELRRAATSQVTVTVGIEDATLADYLKVTFEDTPEGLRIDGKQRGGFLSGWFSGWFGESREVQFVVEVPEKLNADLETGGGHIQLVDIEGTVNLETSGGHIRFETVTGDLTAHTSGGHIKGQHVTGIGALDTSGGHISVGEADRDLKVHTSGGHITIGTVHGVLDASTSGGNIEVQEVAGAMDLHTSGGNIEAAECGGDAEVSTSGGDITLGGMRGHVTAKTSGGDLKVVLAAGNAAGADLSTSGGSVALEVPPGIGFKIDARASGATVDARLPQMKVEGTPGKDHLEAVVGAGGSLLRVRSTQGEIRISETAAHQ
ncbi:MAG TPA: DUF4097 family beta strand repeat-containing protein [Candidatus Polarisedimenticolia bacterium]|nr:DUF4097 family beta strand repeat-containing protein [Candidatus Polarisedimenticolia bacterium]